MKTVETGLSEVQREAVETVGKNICVSAGAGSGKTRVLVERFLYLVAEHHVSPQALLAVTFTEKAANEMKRRIVARLREQGLEEERREVENAYIGTIHSFCARLLREHPIEGGVDPHFNVLEAHEAELLQGQALDEALEGLAGEKEVFDFLLRYGERSIREGILEGYKKSRHSETPFEEILRTRTQADFKTFEAELKQGLETIGEKGPVPTDTASLVALKGRLRATGKQKEAIRKVQRTLLGFLSFFKEEETLADREVFIRLALEFEKRYEALKQKERALDFDDLQLRAVRLLGSSTPASEELRRIYQERFREILVDEFQDTNRLQDRLIELIRRESNWFVVGDFKQSIYGFRGTQVEIFLEREKAFGQSPQGDRISLNENYRSRPELIEFFNRFFAKLWEEDTVPFEPLVPARHCPPEATVGDGSKGDRPNEKREGGLSPLEPSPCVERLVLERHEDETLEEVRIREARSLAYHIRSLVENEGYRYQDIACLFEAMTSVTFYEQAFRRAEIPYFVISTRGFYSQPEVRDLLSFLTTLENPKRDIPLAATLRSPLFQISDETLFWLARAAKKEKKETPLAEGVFALESIAEIKDSEREKLRFFQETFERFLKEKEKLQMASLIEHILRVTGFDLYVLKLRQGERRYANLRKLVELAREMEEGVGLQGRVPLLGDFVRRVKGLEAQEVRESQAQIEAEEGEVVRLLSIHRAKGLEFPVVILPDLGRGEKSEGGEFAISVEEGFGIRETLTFRRNREREERRRSEESKRLLYVAMTRAREKLILSGPETEAGSKASFHELPTWAHWVERILGEGEWEVGEIPEAPPDPFPFERRKPLAERKSIRSRLEALRPVPLRKEPEGIPSILDHLSPPERVFFKRIDLPVSALLLFAKDPEAYLRVYELGAPEAAFPIEIKGEEPSEEETLTRAEFGTRVHQILEQALLRRTTVRQTEPLVFRLTEDLSESEREGILDLIRRFLQGDQAKEIFKARSFHPELPFVLRLPFGLVQGTMDLIYQNRRGEWVILDYKTSEIDGGGGATTSSKGEARFAPTLGEPYRIQMELYALAVHQILGTPPIEARLHFLRPGAQHRILFRPEDFDSLLQKFTSLQEEILEFRNEKVHSSLRANEVSEAISES